MTDHKRASANPRRLTRQESAEQTRRRLLDAAWELFAERGYASITLEQVADHAGVTRTPAYSHFGDKQGLFHALWIDKGWWVSPDLGAITADKSWTALVEEQSTHLRNRLSDPDIRLRIELTLVVFGLGVRNEHLRQNLEKELHTMLATSAQDLARAAEEQGLTLPLPADRLANLFTAVNLGLLQLSLWPSLNISEEDFTHVHLLLLHGVQGQMAIGQHD